MLNYARETLSPNKRKAASERSFTGNEGTWSGIEKITVIFPERLSIRRNANAAVKLVGALIPPSDENEVFSLPHQSYVIKQLSGVYW